MVTAQTVLPFRTEEDLEDYLEAHLSLPGQDVLIIGRQLEIAGGPIDLLAIDSAGVVYIIELKLGKADRDVVAQVLGYRYSMKQLDREKLIRAVADGRLKIDLVKAFQRHFGHRLPETVNESQVLVIIAASIHKGTAVAILELLDTVYSIATFRYVVQSGAVSLIPCCRNDQDVAEGTHLETSASTPPNRSLATPHRSTIRVPVDGNTRRFWLSHAQDFRPVVTFRFIYERYEDWVYAQTDEGVHLRQEGLFGRDLSAIVAESNEWTRVYVAPCSDMAAYDTLMAPSSVRTYRAQGHSHVAYQRNTIGRATPRGRGESPS